jgi:hypothetical protein
MVYCCSVLDGGAERRRDALINKRKIKNKKKIGATRNGIHLFKDFIPAHR